MNKYSLIFLFVFTSSLSFSQNSTLKGVVMYFFNDNFGDKPDIGSEVYLIKSNSVSYIKIQECFSPAYDATIKEYNFLINEFNDTNKELSSVLVVMPKDLKNKRKELKKIIEINKRKLSEYEYMQTECIKSTLNSLNNNSNDVTGFEVVDGSGTFTFQDLEFGKYALYIKSKQRSGKWEYLQVEVNKSYQTISHTFYPDVAKKVTTTDDTY